MNMSEFRDAAFDCPHCGFLVEWKGLHFQADRTECPRCCSELQLFLNVEIRTTRNVHNLHSPSVRRLIRHMMRR